MRWWKCIDGLWDFKHGSATARGRRPALEGEIGAFFGSRGANIFGNVHVHVVPGDGPFAVLEGVVGRDSPGYSEHFGASEGGV